MGADDFILNCPLNQALFGFGDAVCVPVIRWIAHHYLDPELAKLKSILCEAPPALPSPKAVRRAPKKPICP